MTSQVSLTNSIFTKIVRKIKSLVVEFQTRIRPHETHVKMCGIYCKHMEDQASMQLHAGIKWAEAAKHPSRSPSTSESGRSSSPTPREVTCTRSQSESVTEKGPESRSLTS